MFTILEAVPANTVIGNIIVATGAFVILLVLIKLFAWNQITAIFKERAEKISSDIDDAEKSRQLAAELAQKREAELANSRTEAGQIIDRAKETGEATKSTIISDAQEEAKRLKEKANQDIQQSKSEALASVKGDIADLTIDLASKVLTENLDKESQSALITTYLDRLGDA